MRVNHRKYGFRVLYIYVCVPVHRLSVRGCLHSYTFKPSSEYSTHGEEIESEAWCYCCRKQTRTTAIILWWHGVWGDRKWKMIWETPHPLHSAQELCVFRDRCSTSSSSSCSVYFDAVAWRNQTQRTHRHCTEWEDEWTNDGCGKRKLKRKTLSHRWRIVSCVLFACIFRIRDRKWCETQVTRWRFDTHSNSLLYRVHEHRLRLHIHEFLSYRNSYLSTIYTKQIHDD